MSECTRTCSFNHCIALVLHTRIALGGKQAPARLIRKTTTNAFFAMANLESSTVASSKIAFTNHFDNGRQPDIVIWPPKPEILISLELWETASKFQRQTWGLRPWRAQRKCRQMIATTTNNRKLQYGRPIWAASLCCYFRLSVVENKDLVGNYCSYFVCAAYTRNLLAIAKFLVKYRLSCSAAKVITRRIKLLIVINLPCIQN